MILTLVNKTGSTKTYLSGTVSVPGSGSTIVGPGRSYLLKTDGALRSDIFADLMHISDGTNEFGGNDAIDYLRQVPESANDGNHIDGFGRLRISDTALVESLHFANSNHPLLINSSLTGSATQTFNSGTSSIRLTTTTSSSDSAIIQTKRYFRYNPGRSYIVTVSGNLGAKKANTKQRVGYFDANNGMFFEQDSSNLKVVIRTNASGSPVDTVVNQSSWNLDPLDGTGPSGVTLDTSKHNLYFIDFLWHGAGRVRFGIISNGKVIYCHQSSGSNVSATPFIRTPSLPLRVELTNTGTVESSTTLDLVCFAFQKEASDDTSASYSFSKTTAVRTAINVQSTLIPLLSIRPKSTFNSVTNRIPIVPADVSVMTNQQNIYCAVILNPTLTGASFSSVDANSAVEADTSATATSGGTIVHEFFVPASSSLSSSVSSAVATAIELITLGLDIAGTTADILTVAAQSTAGGSSTWANFSWQEFQ